MRWRTSKSTPHCLAISHTCRASTSARPLRRANSADAVAGGVPEEAALQVHLALHVLALGAHLDGALQLALKLGAGDPRKGLLEDDHVVDDGLLHPIRPRPQVGARKAHAHPLGPVVLWNACPGWT